MNLTNRFFSKFINIGFVCAVALLLLLFYLSYNKTQSLSAVYDQVNETYLVRMKLKEVVAELKDTESRQRAFLLTGDRHHLGQRDNSHVLINSLITEISTLAKDAPAQASQIAEISGYIDAYFAHAPIPSGGQAQEDDLAERQRLMDRIIKKTEDIAGNEITMLQNLEKERDRQAALTPTLLLLLFYTALLALVFSYITIKKELEYSAQQLKSNQAYTNTISELLQAFHHAEEIAQKGHWQHNLKNGATSFSDNFYRLLGYEPREFDLTPENFLEYIHPEDQPQVARLWERLVREKTGGMLEYRVLRKDGRLRHMRANAKVVRNARGEDLVLGITQDVTESYEMRRQLEERTRFAQLLTDSSVDIISAYDTELRIVSWNRRSEQLFGIPKEMALGRTVEEVFPHMRNSERMDELHEALKGNLVRTPPRQYPLGHWFYESYIVPLTNESGAITGALAVAHDVTEQYLLRRELEERVQFTETLLDNLVDAVVAMDKDLNYLAFNKTSEVLSGRKKEEVLGKNALEIFPEIQTHPEILGRLQEALTGKTVRFTNYSSVATNRVLDYFFVPMLQADKSVIGVLSIAHDITESFRLRQQLEDGNRSLEEKNHELARSNEELASFSYVASHDLQEPLRKIQSFADLILRNDHSLLSDSGKDSFRRIQAAANRMQNLIDDLLAYSRINTTPVHFEVVDLDQLLDKVRQDLNEEIRREQAVIDAVPLPNARVIPFQFRQLLINLIGNSIKYRKRDAAPHIRISCEMVHGRDLDWAEGKKHQAYYKLVIADNGIGFDPEYSERIFGLFQRLHGRSEYSGTGIGLTICKKIIENHGGRIIAAGERGKGAEFTVYFPA